MTRLASRLPLSLLATCMLVACGGDDFTPGPSGTSGTEASSSGSAAGGSSSAGAGGEGAQGGDSSSSSSTGGREGCKAGEYLDDGSQRCRSCSDFTDFEFDAPVDLPVAGPGDNWGGGRVQVHGDVLLMTYQYYDGGFDLGRSDPPYDVGEPLVEVNTDDNEAGPLLLPEGTAFPDLPSPGSDAYIFFERPALNANALYARLVGGGPETLLPSPFNDGTSDSSIAFAFEGSKAIFWTTKRTLEAAPYEGLVTYNDATGQLAKVEIALPGGCFPEEVLAPWVTPKGDRLFFNAVDCVSGNLLIYQVDVDDNGQPLGAAEEIHGLADGAEGVGAPSLSPDGCDLYYTAVVELAAGNFVMRTAHRK